ncbi:MAG: hypothetical protein RL120_09905, partial [Gammaproteobacteria bacterium]
GCNLGHVSALEKKNCGGCSGSLILLDINATKKRGHSTMFRCFSQVEESQWRPCSGLFPIGVCPATAATFESDKGLSVILACAHFPGPASPKSLAVNRVFL